MTFKIKFPPFWDANGHFCPVSIVVVRCRCPVSVCLNTRMPQCLPANALKSGPIDSLMPAIRRHGKPMLHAGRRHSKPILHAGRRHGKQMLHTGTEAAAQWYREAPGFWPFAMHRGTGFWPFAMHRSTGYFPCAMNETPVLDEYSGNTRSHWM